MHTQIQQGISALGLTVTNRQLERLELYINEIKLWNPVCKLVADTDDLAVRHVLDSLAGVPGIQSLNPKSIADVGSGAGFPGIPLALWLKNTRVTLIERSKRRAGFLRNVVRLLNLDNAIVLEKPVEEAVKDGPFDVITFRGWRALDRFTINKLLPVLAEGGAIAAYKGRAESWKTELENTAPRGRTAILKLQVPGLKADRYLLILRPKGYGVYVNTGET